MPPQTRGCGSLGAERSAGTSQISASSPGVGCSLWLVGACHAQHDRARPQRRPVPQHVRRADTFPRSIVVDRSLDLPPPSEVVIQKRTSGGATRRPQVQRDGAGGNRCCAQEAADHQSDGQLPRLMSSHDETVFWRPTISAIVAGRYQKVAFSRWSDCPSRGVSAHRQCALFGVASGVATLHVCSRRRDQAAWSRAGAAANAALLGGFARGVALGRNRRGPRSAQRLA